jgi:hypothetical protein
MTENVENIVIPRYIETEIEEYTRLTKQGYCKCMMWENIIILLRLACVNNHITIAEVKYIEEKYCLETH